MRDFAHVPQKKSTNKTDRLPRKLPQERVSLKVLADYVGLAPATVSLVMNRSAVADSIPRETQDRIFEAARKLNYRPNFYARSLRTQRSFTIGVMVPEVSEGYAALVMSGIEDHLLNEGYFYFVASHRHRADLIEEYPKLLLSRSVDGLIAVDTPWQQDFPLPVVTVSGHYEKRGITNIELDHARAAELALQHLAGLKHEQIAFIKGQAFSSDTEVRWNSIREVANKLGIKINPRLVVQLEGDSPTPEPGYLVTKRLLESGQRFTALFAFNDISAIGAISALRDAGLRVPTDISVVGFDDIQSAAFQNPRLTTVRQPLHKMGQTAAATLLQKIVRPEPSSTFRRITVEPDLIIRDSTAVAQPSRRRTPSP
jgi:LacI family transcriptional regulator